MLLYSANLRNYNCIGNYNSNSSFSESKTENENGSLVDSLLIQASLIVIEVEIAIA